MDEVQVDQAWIKTGDRSHPALKLIDELTHQLTYDGFEDDLMKLEAAHLCGDEFDYDNMLHQVRELQRLDDGDRSHPRLARLDDMKSKLNYDCWEEDFEAAMQKHVSYEADCMLHEAIEKMKNKQALHDGDRSHEMIQFLNLISINFTYPDAKEDAEEAMDWHMDGYSGVDYFKKRMSEKQRMFDGDRRHPRLVMLDSLVLTYPGWEEDVREVEKKHTSCDFIHEINVNENFELLIQRLKDKQLKATTGEEDTSSMHPTKRKILQTEWTYPGWQEDVDKVREEWDYVTQFDIWLEKCELRQMVHDGDFLHHPALAMLWELDLSYPGWQADSDETKSHLLSHGYELYEREFQGKINGMKIKQQIFNGVPKDAYKPPPAGGNCAICWEEPCTHAFVPCGHLCACQRCGDSIMKASSAKCPICKQKTQLLMRVYLSGVCCDAS